MNGECYIHQGIKRKSAVTIAGTASKRKLVPQENVKNDKKKQTSISNFFSKKKTYNRVIMNIFHSTIQSIFHTFPIDFSFKALCFYNVYLSSIEIVCWFIHFLWALSCLSHENIYSCLYLWRLEVNWILQVKIGSSSDMQKALT